MRSGACSPTRVSASAMERALRMRTAFPPAVSSRRASTSAATAGSSSTWSRSIPTAEIRSRPEPKNARAVRWRTARSTAWISWSGATGLRRKSKTPSRRAPTTVLSSAAPVWISGPRGADELQPGRWAHPVIGDEDVDPATIEAPGSGRGISLRFDMEAGIAEQPCDGAKATRIIINDEDADLTSGHRPQV